MKRKHILLILISIFSSTNCLPQDYMEIKKKTSMDLNEEMKIEFEEIIDYFKSNDELHAVNEVKVRSFIDYLLDQTAYTKKRLSEVIIDINYETIERDEEYKVWPDVEFWRGVDDYGSNVMLNYDGGVADVENQDNVIIGRYHNYVIPPDSVRLKEHKESQSIKVDISKYPISHLGYHEYRFGETSLFYAWIAKIWQEVEGHKCGIKVKTIQNNSIATFSLNDFLDGDFSEYTEASYGEKPERLKNPFPRKLSLIELYLRASQSSYPFNPFNTYWRYFEKDGQFKEVGTYEFETGIRTGSHEERMNAELSDVIKHENSKTALLYIRDFTNKMINEGWEEKLRPIEMASKFHENAFQFGYWTGIFWSDDQTTKLTNIDLINLEKSLNIKLPKPYFHYLRILNGRQHNSYDMHFPIDDLYTIHMKSFFTINELPQFNTLQSIKDSDILIIGETTDEKKVGIGVNSKTNTFGKMHLVLNEEVVLCDYSFEIFSKYAQGSPKQPEIYAAEQNDYKFLKKRINEGWDVTTSYQYQNALSQAASHNSYEAIEVLLKAGARLKHKKYREHMISAYDEKTMKILDKYHKEE